MISLLDRLLEPVRRLHVTSACLILALACGTVNGQGVTVINATDTIAASRVTLNSNFAYLDARILRGTGAPAATCNATTNLTVFYIRQDAGAENASLYLCDKIGSSSYGWSGPFITSIANVVLNNQANAFSTGLQDFGSAKIKLPLTVVGSLPTASSNTSTVFQITDGLTSADCTSGGGSTRSLCTSNGSIWVSIGGGSGAISSFQLTDLSTLKTSATVLTIGTFCSSSARCSISFGGLQQYVTASATVTLGGSLTHTGSAYAWVQPGPIVYVGVPASWTSGGNTTVCSGCTVVTATAFPDNVSAALLSTWTAATGVWATSDPSFDKRAFLSAPPQYTPGPGCASVTNVAGVVTVSCGGGALYSLNTLITYTSGAYVMAPVNMTGCAAIVCSCISTVTPKATNTGTTAQALRITYTDALTNDAGVTIFGNSAAGVPFNGSFVVNSKAATTPTVDVSLGGAVSGDKFSVNIVCR